MFNTARKRFSSSTLVLSWFCSQALICLQLVLRFKKSNAILRKKSSISSLQPVETLNAFYVNQGEKFIEYKCKKRKRKGSEWVLEGCLNVVRSVQLVVVIGRVTLPLRLGLLVNTLI